ncbi:uncharacterized protein [Phaseolus vulgaris]|uniref:uncharacterized protein n=1 Tax=Phaseolus vulgaris TaxID=3885 RepID=UPI0035CA0266
MSDSEIVECNNRLRREATQSEVTRLWEVGKRLGTTCSGDAGMLIKEMETLEDRDNQVLRNFMEGDRGDSRCFSLWGDNKVGWVHNDGVNGAGSTLSMWHKEAFHYVSHTVGKGFIAVVGHHVKSNCSCIIINVYAACNPSEKVSIWEVVSAIRSIHQDKVWCCCGDFNAVRCAAERKGIRRNASNKKEIRDFNDFIGSNSMEDLPIVGKKFTWFKADGSAKSRLDRILGPKPFKSIDAWLLEPGFKDLVRDKWGSYEVQGNNITKVKEKLKLLKLDLKEFNRSVFGNLEDEKRKILKEIEDLDVKDGVSDLLEGEKLRRLELVSQQKLVEKKMESLYRQKARSNWYKYGDSNSKFYHTTIGWRRLKNEVKGVELNNQWCEEPEAVRREIKRVFEERFKATPDLGVRLGAVEFRSLPEEVSLKMIEVFSEEEVTEAV